MVRVSLFGQCHASYINALSSCYIDMELVRGLENVFMCVTSDTSWLVLILNYTQVTGVPPSPGCPALVTALFCPMTNVIHPNKDSTLCVTVLSYSNRGAVEVYVAYVNHSMIVERNFICIADLALGRTIRGSFLVDTGPFLCSLALKFKQREPISAWIQVSI